MLWANCGTNALNILNDNIQDPMPILEARHVTKTYQLDHRVITVLEDVSLSVAPGEFIIIQGSSGSGKTTLLTMLSGLDFPTQGQLFIDGREITHASEDQLAPLRNRDIGFVFQAFHLVPSMTARENIMLPAELKGDRDAGKRADALLERVGLSGRAKNLPSQLSGGEKQRVALARALILKPELVLCDEPTGNLDHESAETVVSLLFDLHKRQKNMLIVVTHNLEVAGRFGKKFKLSNARLQSV